MSCLAASLVARADHEVLWRLPASGLESVTAGQLRRALALTPVSAYRGKRVAIGPMPVAELLATLVMLDGLAAAILMLPAEEERAATEARMQQAGMEVLLEGAGAGLLAAIGSAAAAIGGAGFVGGGAGPALDGSGLAPGSLTADRDFTDLVSRDQATIWLMPTSGTTGSPKLIAHTFASLTKSMARPGAGKQFTWGCLYSVRRFAGLQVFLQAWLAATPLIVPEDGADSGDTLARLVAAGCNALSATPSMWRKLSMLPGFAALPLQQITLGGEIVDQAVLDLLRHHFPQARITHIYASTEAGVGFAVRDGKAGFPLAFLHTPPGNVLLRMDANGHLCFAAAPGTPRLAGLALVDAAGIAAGAEGHDGWLDSGDVVQVAGDRVLFLGRANGSINVGGNKVMPEEVELVIKELPQIAFVQVRARRSGVLGSLVEAAVTLVPGHVLDAACKKQITAHCRARLEGFKVPAFIVELARIELTASGKMSRLEKVNPT